MRFSFDFPFDEEDDIFLDAEVRFPGKSLIHPPVSGIKPLSIISKVGNDFMLSPYTLSGILKKPSAFSTKTNSTSPGVIAASPYLDFDDASTILKSYLNELGIEKPNDVLQGLQQYESISIDLRQLRDISLANSLPDLETWLGTQKVDDNNPLVKDWLSKEQVSLFVALSVGKTQAVRIHLQPKDEDVIENAAGTGKIKVGANKYITFSGGPKPTIALQMLELLEENGNLSIKDPSKGGGGGRGKIGPSG